MQKVLSVGSLGAVVLGAALALSAQAAEVKAPASVSESAPAKTDKDAAKGKAGTPALPSKGPATVSESAPAKTGKEPPAPAVRADSANMPNPKTPSSVNESAPSKAVKGSTSDTTTKKPAKEKETAPR